MDDVAARTQGRVAANGIEVRQVHRLMQPGDGITRSGR